MTNPQILKKAIRRELAKRHLIHFLHYDHGDNWIPGAHLDLLCDKLEAVERGEIRRLIVSMPPRHGKSETISRKYPAWYLGRNPDREIILSSYGAELAYDLSRDARATLRQWGKDLWNVEIDPESSAVGRWGIANHRGGLMASGVGGPVTGRGAHLAICDDPLKDWAQASSATFRDSVFDWYRTVLRTRLAPDGAIIIVMTRWHTDDFAGRLIEEAKHGGEEWEVVSLPAIAEEQDILGRNPGDALWPTRYPIEALEATRQSMGSQMFDALYQQHPTLVGGNIIKSGWLKYYTRLPEYFESVIQSWDLSFKGGDSNDYVVGQVWGTSGADCYLIDQVRSRLDFPDTIRAIQDLKARYPETQEILIEDAANGAAAVATLRHQIPGIIPVKVKGSKETRLGAVSYMIEAGNVFLPLNAPWTGDLVAELTSFPSTAHDDQTDALSQALARLQTSNIPDVVSYKY